jgi:hypothetical protein
MKSTGGVIRHVPSLYRAFATLLGFFAVAAVAIWSTYQGHGAFGAVLALVDLAVSGWLFVLVRCRRCGELVLYRRLRRGAGTRDYVGLPLDGRCSKCGAELWRF